MACFLASLGLAWKLLFSLPKGNDIIRHADEKEETEKARFQEEEATGNAEEGRLPCEEGRQDQDA